MLQRASENRVPVTKTVTYPSPSSGWVQSGNILNAGLDQAEVLDNFICTAQGARLRGGASEFADASASVKSLFVYASAGSETMFASTTTAIYDASDIAGGSLRTPTSGDWSTVQTSTTGGQFLVGVNGTDTGFTYNGSTFSDLALTGVAEDALSQVWLFKNRLFFVEEGTTSAWYLATDAIGGTATELDVGSVFAKGGALLFGATWSLDSGSGLDDVCLFFSETGEVAVYEGSDPASASTWSLVGVYDIGKPLNKLAAFKAGGDLAVLTEDGIIPISEALRKDRAALQAVAITYPIEDAWQDAIANRTTSFPINATLWQRSTLLLIGTPQKVNNQPVAFAANARTGAWSRIVGWDVRCSVVFGDDLYFGTDDGKIMKADVGGSDGGSAYTGYYVPKFAPMDTEAGAQSVYVNYKAATELDFDMYAHADYQVDDMPAPVPFSVSGTTSWGTGVWGTFVWGADSNAGTYHNWQSAYANGSALAPGLAITSNQTDKPVFEVLVTKLRAEVGYQL